LADSRLQHRLRARPPGGPDPAGWRRLRRRGL